MKQTSRYQIREQKRFTKNILIVLSFLIFLLVIFIFYGIPFLINLSLLAQNSNSNPDNDIITSSSAYVAPPVFDPIADATNQDTISISGYAMPEQKVKLYLNDSFFKESSIGKDKRFTFENVKLKEGVNEIRAKSINYKNKESKFSNTIKIIYKKDPPKIEVQFPSNGLKIPGDKSNQIMIKGTTGQGSRVTVNDFWAIVDNNGNFSYLFNLQKGENKIKITAVDEAGNKTEKELIVHKD